MTQRDPVALLRVALGWTVLVAWATTFVLDVLGRPTELQGGAQILMVIVAGFLFAPSLVRRNGNARRNGNGATA